MNKFNSELAQIIKEKRIEKNLTQEEIARKLKTKRSTYANWETGIRRIDMNAMMQICDVLDLDIVEITNHMRKYL